MKLITFNKAFEIENIIVVILRFFSSQHLKIRPGKMGLEPINLIKLEEKKKNTHTYIYIYIYMNMDLVFLDP